jgi:DNA-binding MarR family transcriptional regulator
MAVDPHLPPGLSALFQFRHMSDLVGARVAERHPNLTANEISLLLHLAQPGRIKDLAEMLTCQPSNKTPLEARCETRGWVIKTRSQQDARTVFVALTDAGRALRHALIQEIADLIEETSGRSTQDFEEILQILTRRGTSG